MPTSDPVKQRAKVARYKERHPDRVKETAKKVREERRRRVIGFYSPNMCCISCGFTDIRALSIDHINGDGAQHRRDITIGLYQWLERNEFPEGYQVLCMNCQFIKRVENNEVRQALLLPDDLTKKPHAGREGFYKGKHYPKEVVDAAIALRLNRGATYHGIRRELETMFGVKLSIATIRNWCLAAGL